MGKNEIDVFVKKFNQYTKKLANSKKNSQKYLKDSGIYTEKGNLKKIYIDTCTAQKII